MLESSSNLSTPAQRERLARFGATDSVDLHCHCLPAVDDGPGNLIESLDLCRGLAADGITTAIATPHQLGRYQGRNDGASVRKAVESLNASLVKEGIPLVVVPGGDVRIDERIVELLATGEVLTLGDRGRFVLLELPHDVFIEPLPLIERLAAQRIFSIVSHPERNRAVVSKPQVVSPWLAAGAMLQVTAGSLVGDFGPAAQRAAWYWLEIRQAELVASDAHDMQRRPPRMSKAIDLITRRLGEATARRVCVENPNRILTDCEVAPPHSGPGPVSGPM